MEDFKVKSRGGEEAVSTGGVRWAHIGLALLCVMGLLEISSRILIHKYVGRPFKSFDPYIFSGYGVYRSNPNYTHSQFVHNSVGFRNTREFDIHKPAKTFRVMCIGASVLYSGSALTHQGWSPRVHTDETISAYLGSLLCNAPELSGYEVEVINAAINRQGIREILPYYFAELGAYDPDIVLIFGTANNITINNNIHSLFHDHKHPTGLNVAEITRLELLANGTSFPAVVEKVVRVLVNRSALAALLYRITDKVLQGINVRNAILVSSQVGSKLGNGERSVPQQKAPVWQDDKSDKNLRLYIGLLDALSVFVEAQGATPVVFWEYYLKQIDDIKPLSPYERDLARFYPGEADRDEKERFYVRDQVAKHLRDRGILMIDLIEDLRHYSGDVFNDYLHYSPQGNRWVAERIAEYIRPIVRRRSSCKTLTVK